MTQLFTAFFKASVARHKTKVMIALTCCAILAVTEGRGEPAVQPRVLARFAIPGDGDLLIVPVTTLGNQYPFILDTGSGRVNYDRSLEKLLGTPIARGAADALNGQIGIELFASPQIGMGALRLSKANGRTAPLVGSIDMRQLRSATGHGFFGILGMSVLFNRVIELDFERGALMFLDAVGPDPGDRVDLAFGADGIPAIRAVLPGGAEVTLDVDTGFSAGSSSLTLTSEIVRRLEANHHISGVRTTTTVGVSGGRKNRMLQLESLRVGAFPPRQLFAKALHDDSPRPNGCLGLAYWSRYAVTFDFPNNAMYLKPNSHFSRPDRDYLAAAGEFGIRLTRANERVLVANVFKDTIAGRLGLKPSDALLALDETDLSHARLLTVNKAFHDAAGRRVVLSVKRGDHTLTFRAKLPIPSSRRFEADDPSDAENTPRETAQQRID